MKGQPLNASWCHLFFFISTGLAFDLGGVQDKSISRSLSDCFLCIWCGVLAAAFLCRVLFSSGKRKPFFNETYN